MTASEAARAARAEQRKLLAERTAFLRSTRDRVVALLRHALEEIKTTLAGAPSDYQLWSLPQLAAEIRQTLAKFAQDAGAEISTAAGTAWEAGAASIERPLEAAGVRLAGVLPMLDTRQLLAMRAFMVDRIKNVGVQAASRITSELGLVVIGTQSPSEAIAGATQILGETSRARATTIVRTELGRAFAVASFERLQQAKAKVPGLKKQWRKSGKLHPRLHHELADGQVQEIEDPFILAGGRVKLMFPHDPKAPASEVINCGCLALPFKADWSVMQPGRVPGGAVEDGVPVDRLVANLRESFNKNQRRAPKGTHGGGRWVTGPHLPTLAAGAIADRQRHTTHDLGAVTVGNAAAVQKATGVRIDGYRRQANDSHLRHILDTHGDQGVETQRYHQRAVTPADFAQIRAITSRPDSVTLSPESRRGSAALVYQRRIRGEVFVYTEAVHRGHYRLELLTLYVRAAKKK